MALTYLSTTISNPAGGKPLTRKMLVDSGATYSVVPATTLKKLKIKPIKKQKFILANGEEIEKFIGEARFAIGKDQPQTLKSPAHNLIRGHYLG